MSLTINMTQLHDFGEAIAEIHEQENRNLTISSFQMQLILAEPILGTVDPDVWADPDTITFIQPWVVELRLVVGLALRPAPGTYRMAVQVRDLNTQFTLIAPQNIYII